MDSAFARLIDTIGLPLPDKAIREALFRFAHECGFNHFSYFSLQGFDSFAVSNYPSEWLQSYTANSYHFIDPVITETKRGTRLFSWSIDDTLYGTPTTNALIQFYNEARKFGIRSGFSVAGPTGFGQHAIISLASDRYRFDDIKSIDPILAATAATLVHCALTRQPTDASLTREVGLTPHETSCLRWVAEGKSIQEIADILGIGFRSVRGYLDEVKAKLSVNSTVQAVAIASRLQLI